MNNLSEQRACANCGQVNIVEQNSNFKCQNCKTVNTFYPGDNTHFCLAEADPSTTSTKPSNPKYIIGIRKAPMSTVSAPVMAEIGVAMLEGALKYGRHNYRAVGVRSSVYYDATIRHLFSWWEGEDTDPDSGMSHITKAITSLVVLRDAMIHGLVEDDRAPSSPEFYKELNEKAGKLIDAREGKEAPKHYTIKDSKHGNK